MELGQLKSAGLVDYQTLLTENEKLKQDMDQCKRERDELSQKLDKECNMSLNIEGQLHDAIKEKTELKEETVKLNKLIEIRNKALKGAGVIIENQNSIIKNLKSENEALRLQADEYFEFWQETLKNESISNKSSWWAPE